MKLIQISTIKKLKLCKKQGYYLDHEKSQES